MGELKDTTSDLCMKTTTRPNVKMAYFILFFFHIILTLPFLTLINFIPLSSYLRDYKLINKKISTVL